MAIPCMQCDAPLSPATALGEPPQPVRFTRARRRLWQLHCAHICPQMTTCSFSCSSATLASASRVCSCASRCALPACLPKTWLRPGALRSPGADACVLWRRRTISGPTATSVRSASTSCAAPPSLPCPSALGKAGVPLTRYPLRCGRTENPDDRARRQDDQAANLGHCGPGALPHDQQHLLPRRARHHRRV